MPNLGPKSVEKSPIMYSIKVAILDSLHGKNPPNNDYKNLAYFKRFDTESTLTEI